MTFEPLKTGLNWSLIIHIDAHTNCGDRCGSCRGLWGLYCFISITAPAVRLSRLRISAGNAVCRAKLQSQAVGTLTANRIDVFALLWWSACTLPKQASNANNKSCALPNESEFGGLVQRLEKHGRFFFAACSIRAHAVLDTTITSYGGEYYLQRQRW